MATSSEFFERSRLMIDAWRDACQAVLVDEKTQRLMRVDAFRRGLSSGRQHWFDTLSEADQIRLASLAFVDRRSDDQKDWDEYKQEMEIYP